MSTGTIGSTSTIEQTEIDPTTGGPRSAHIIAPKDGVAGHVLAMEARFEGTPVTALCGHVFVPQRDPKALPTCQACVDIFEEKTGAQDGWEDS